MDTAKRIYNVLFISVFATMLGLGVVSPLLPIYAENLGATGIWLGIIFSALRALSRSIFMPIIGRISDRQGEEVDHPHRDVRLRGPLAWPTSSPAASTRSRPSASPTGIASAMVVPIAMAYIADLSEKGKEGSHMGNFSISMFLGMGGGAAARRVPQRRLRDAVGLLRHGRPLGVRNDPCRDLSSGGKTRFIQEPGR